MVFVCLVDHRAINLGLHFRLGSSQAVHPDLDYVRVPLGHIVHLSAGFSSRRRPVDLVRRGGQGGRCIRNAYTAVGREDCRTIDFAFPLLLANLVQKVTIEPQG